MCDTAAVNMIHCLELNRPSLIISTTFCMMCFPGQGLTYRMLACSALPKAAHADSTLELMEMERNVHVP